MISVLGAPASDWHGQWPFWQDATTNQRNGGLINAYTVAFNSQCFFSLVDCCLAVQTADFCHKGPMFKREVAS
jgi:hypothetical protein